MSEKERPRTNPRAGSSDPELWDLNLDWYFNDFDSLCGLQSVGTSGAGENQIRKPTEEEKAEHRQRLRNGFLLTMPAPPKTGGHHVSSADADNAAFAAMANGIFAHGRWIWKRLARLPYREQDLLRLAYTERIREAGSDWGRKPLTDDQVRALHRAWAGRPYELPSVPEELREPGNKAWKNPKPEGAPHSW